MRRIVTATAVLGGLLASIWVPVATPAFAADASSPYFGYSTGTLVHADVIQAATAGPRVVDAEASFSGATVDSAGFTGAVVNEMQEPVKPAAKTGNSYGRGDAVEAGLATNLPNDPNGNQLKLPSTLAEASAPPSSPLVTNDVLKLPANPVVYAALLRGQAQALWNASSCILGQPISFGLGHEVDLQLLSTTQTSNDDGTFAAPLVATDANGPSRAVGQSISYTYLAPNFGGDGKPDGTFGLVTETHQTFAPVTLFKGTANEVTIEVLGEWVLRTTATGKPGGAKVDYAPAGRVTPSTPVLRILQKNADGTIKDNKVLDVQDVFGKTGLTLPSNPVVGLSVGEAPRKIAAPGKAVENPQLPPVTSGDGTAAEAAVDVVRVSLLEPVPDVAPRALELRIGHMESTAHVPLGGVHCPIPVKKTIDKDPVGPGDTFKWTINIPTDKNALLGLACDLVGISATDDITILQGTPKFTLTGASNGGVITGNNKVVWSNLGNYHPGGDPIVVTINGTVDPLTGAGLIQDTVSVTASLGNCTGGAVGQQLVGIARLTNTALSGTFTLTGPKANAVLGATVTRPANLPRTGAVIPVGLALAAVLSAAAMRGVSVRARRLEQ